MEVQKEAICEKCNKPYTFYITDLNDFVRCPHCDATYEIKENNSGK